ncbi:GNAT family acetyltransferase [Piscinibacter sakaiensis]|uniref:GNAT family acetyltransferase n=1 Tax=Piscinibacter sakaiensis TaxID=1547922 RepID=UPI003AACAAB1
MPTEPQLRPAEPPADGPVAVTIRAFADADEDAVVALWQACGLTRPWNDPHRDIERKRAVQRELFLVAEDGERRVVASVMGGYDGHRGWINYLAVDPRHQRQGIAAALVRELEARLLALGCPKLNLQVRSGNEAANRFYESLGYQRDDVVSFGRRLIPD